MERRARARRSLAIPAAVFELLAKGEPSKEQAEVKALFEEGLSLYREQKWDEATKKFQAALKVSKDDGPSLTFVNRCKLLKVAPPPKSWDGVYEMTTK